MRFHRFYIQTPITEDTFDITDRDLIHQWRSVFRYNVGSQVILFDGSGTDYLCMITSLRNLGATASVIKKTKTADVTQRKNLWLCVALVKKDNFELVVEKATELGVNHIVPIICEHSEKRKIKMDRMQKIAIEASEQSGRSNIPQIHEITTIQDLFQSGVLPQEKIAFHPTGISFKQYINSTNSASFACFIGPEGGFTRSEIEMAEKSGCIPVSIGHSVLRIETAVVAISAMLLYAYSD